MSKRQTNQNTAECPDDISEAVQSIETGLDVPTDAPCVYLTRDTCEGSPSAMIDVWTSNPKRNTIARASGRTDITFTPQHADGQLFSAYLGPHRPDVINDRFHALPDGGQCVVIDNPSVN